MVIWKSSPEWNQELYEQTAAKALSGIDPPDEQLPEGAIADIAMPRAEGGWQVLEVWENEDALRVLRDRAALEGSEEGFADLRGGRVVPLGDDLRAEIAELRRREKQPRSKSR